MDGVRSMRIYPYSIKPGGLWNDSRDGHAQLRHAQQGYINFNQGGVHWTSHAVKIPAREHVWNIGNTLLRARCGNTISATPQQPTLPPAEEAEVLQMIDTPQDETPILPWQPLMAQDISIPELAELVMSGPLAGALPVQGGSGNAAPLAAGFAGGGGYFAGSPGGGVAIIGAAVPVAAATPEPQWLAALGLAALVIARKVRGAKR
jgi:hypothetical protein